MMPEEDGTQKPPWERTPDMDLWSKVTSMAQGEVQARLEAVKILWTRHFDLPEEAVNKAIRLAQSDQPREVRLETARFLLDGGTPWGLVNEVLDILSQDPDAEIRRLAEERRERLNELLSAPLIRMMQGVTGTWSANLLRFADTTDALVRLNEGLLKSIEKIVLPREILDTLGRFQTSFSPIIDQAIEIATEMSTEEFRKFEAEMGWLEFLPMKTFWNLYILSKESDLERAWEKVVDDFEQGEVLDWLLEDLHECALFRSRMGIIEIGFNHHRRGDWISSISVLLPQVEGLIWDVGVALAIVDPTPNSRARLDKNGKTILHTSGRFKGTPVEWNVGGLVAHLWNEKRFEDYFGRRIYTHEFRHPILHGRRVDLFSEKESTAGLLYLKAIKERCDQLKLC